MRMCLHPKLRCDSHMCRSTLQDLELTTRTDISKLLQFEIASLGNLVTLDQQPEEVIAWIPSLSRFSEENITVILDSISRVKSRLHS